MFFTILLLFLSVYIHILSCNINRYYVFSELKRKQKEIVFDDIKYTMNDLPKYKLNPPSLLYIKDIYRYNTSFFHLFNMNDMNANNKNDIINTGKDNQEYNTDFIINKFKQFGCNTIDNIQLNNLIRQKYCYMKKMKIYSNKKLPVFCNYVRINKDRINKTIESNMNELIQFVHHSYITFFVFCNLICFVASLFFR